jgi:hypothetical protein
MIQNIVLLGLVSVTLLAQGRGGGIPGATEAQTEALVRMAAECAAQQDTVAAARAAMNRAPYSGEALGPKADALAAAELALANARAEAFAKLQASAGKLAPNQVAALAASGGTAGRGGRGGQAYAVGGGTIPKIREAQERALMKLTTDVMPLSREVNAARAAVVTASLAQPGNPAEIRTRVEALKRAEMAVATMRARDFTQLQESSERLSAEQVAAFVAIGGSFANVAFTQPEPLDFAWHEGYVSLFDGVSLKGWDGNPKFWRVEGGAIVGESTPQNPSGNSYLVYRDMEAKDFTLKFEIKVEGSGGSGFQYRSKTGLPWLANIADNVTANVGPVNLNWMMTGPQADFWPSSPYWTGQFYSENTPMRIQAWRGQVVEGAGFGTKRLMGDIGNREALGKLVKMNDWNEYTVIARGGTLMHVLNGQLMAVMVDDDPESSNNQAGLFGIEIEATTKVSVRNIWVRKLK